MIGMDVVHTSPVLVISKCFHERMVYTLLKSLAAGDSLCHAAPSLDISISKVNFSLEAIGLSARDVRKDSAVE
jgi:hypothetical protein